MKSFPRSKFWDEDLWASKFLIYLIYLIYLPINLVILKQSPGKINKELPEEPGKHDRKGKKPNKSEISCRISKGNIHPDHLPPRKHGIVNCT